jgi:hypothetical protein
MASRVSSVVTRTALATGLVMAPIGLVQQLAPSAASATAGCSAPNTTLLTHRPTVTKLPHGGTLNVWDNHASGYSALRITQVVVPPSSALHLTVFTAGALTRAKSPAEGIKSHPNVVAVSNGDVFDPIRGSLPVGDEVLNGSIVKGEREIQNTVSVGRDGHSYPGHIQLYGHVTAGGRKASISGLNWQAVVGSGINVYATPWGDEHRPYGDVDVVVRNGTVRAVRHGAARGRPPTDGAQILTGFGAAASFLDNLRVGEAVTVKYGFTAFGYMPRDHVGKVEFAVHRGTPYWFRGGKWPVDCDARDEMLRPRTAIGWTRTGVMMMVAVSGRVTAGGTPFGGSTVHNMQYYLGVLENKYGGRSDAEAMDGGTSTTLDIRQRIDGSIIRVDRPGADQRHVPNFLALIP